MFLFTPSVFLKELQTHAPLIHAQIHKNQFQKIEEGIYELLSKEVYDEMPSLSIDYALMEHSRRTMLCPLSLSWSDIGSWESVYEMMDKDCNQNAKYGNTFEIESQNNLIFGGKKLIVAIGVEDLAIIDTPDAICIVKKSESQKVKQLVQLLYPTL
jgi:mannose-1-phosphate guanylyltransferase/mannose-6-phosphate isomerase